MEFTRRYPRWLVIPPSLIGFTLSLVFLSFILQLTAREWLIFWIAFVVIYGFGLTAFFLSMRREAAKVEDAIRTQLLVPQVLSSCLHLTEILSLALWVGGGVLFGLACAVAIMPTWLGVQYFLEGAMISAASGMAWNYWAAKRLLIRAALRGKDARYVGQFFSFGIKIGMVFIGIFIVSSGALVHLVSNRVSQNLERLALTQSAPHFDRALHLAQAAARLDPETLKSIRDTLPGSDHSLHLILSNGTVTNIGDPLEPGEVEAIRRFETGDSSRYRGFHVARFARLRDGSILVLSTPWAPYEHIPEQVAFFTVIIVFLTTLIFATATFFLSKDLVQPLNALMSLSSEMARGNFQHEVRIFSDDEVGRLADSFRETRNNLRGLLARVSGSGSTITDGVHVITGGTDTLMARSREQNQLTVTSTNAVQSVRNGIGEILVTAEAVTDLTQDASSRALELTSSAEEVARNMDHLFQSVEKTSSSTTQMNASASEMSSRTTVLAGISQEVLAFVSEMESTTEELRRTAQVTSDLSRRVQEDAAQGGTAVSDTVAGINSSQEMTQRASNVLADLQRSVNKISQILNVIEEVADKTNLLSLNAAIIAAQAGEHGLGFTVVADEIRELAERTRGSTKEISGIIKAIQVGSREAMQAMTEGVARVNENVTVVQKASSSLEKIVASAARSGEMAGNIAKALQEQTNASRHLHQATSKMSDHISEIDKSTAEQARGTQLLAVESEKIRDIAAQVKKSTDDQSIAAQGITAATEQIAVDVKSIRDLLQNQMRDADQIAQAADAMLTFAKKNEEIAESFTRAVQSLASSGQNFESEVKRFRFAGTEH